MHVPLILCLIEGMFNKAVYFLLVSVLYVMVPVPISYLLGLGDHALPLLVIRLLGGMHCRANKRQAIDFKADTMRDISRCQHPIKPTTDKAGLRQWTAVLCLLGLVSTV